MKWEIEGIDDGKKYIIRRPDRRVVAVFSYLAKPDVYEGNLPRMFAAADAMLTVCRLIKNAEGESEAVRKQAERIVEFIDDE